jgi:SpoVK/Ycf46/Vps4 family AAA+-type ATPase
MNPPKNNNNKNKISPITVNKKNRKNKKKNTLKDLSYNQHKLNKFLTLGDINEIQQNNNIFAPKNNENNNIFANNNNNSNNCDNKNNNLTKFDELIEKLTSDIINNAINSYKNDKLLLTDKPLDKHKSLVTLKKKYLPSDYLDICMNLNDYENSLNQIDKLLLEINVHFEKINKLKKNNLSIQENQYKNTIISKINTPLAFKNASFRQIEMYHFNKDGNGFKFFNSKLRHQSLPPIQTSPHIKKEKINIKVTINTIKDILDIIEKYPIKWEVEYNINMNALHKVKEPLQRLDNMIGMNNLKKSIVDQILYFIQNFHISKNNKNNDFLHTVIYGPPGTGKTEIAKIIGVIYSKIGILNKNIFKKVTRSDLIAGYLGQTAIKTKTVIEKTLGGVLFIDEAYALGNPEKKDSFAKECLDTLCEALSDYKENLMVIIAGYEEELKNCFFEYNQGLDSRFTWRFHTDDYNYEELFLIFKKKVYDIEWTLNVKVKPSWFQDKMDYFKFYGRDMETLLAKVKIAHSRRVFCLEEKYKRNISVKDMNKGYEIFLNNDEVKKRKNQMQDLYKSMYC